MKIAIFETEQRLDSTSIRKPLLAAGHDFTMYHDDKILMEELRGSSCDLLMIHAPAWRAEIIRLLREAKSAAGGKLPMLLFVDGKTTVAENLAAAYAAGVDEVLLLPVRRTELLARMNALLLRAWPEKQLADQMRVAGFVFDMATANVICNGRRVRLTRKEFDLACLFFRQIGQPLSRATLRESVWPLEAGTTSRTIDTHVSRVRSKLGLQGTHDLRLMPVYGFGYVLERKA